MSKGGRFANNNVKDTQPKKKGGFAKALIALGVVLVLVAAGMIGYTVYDYTMDRMAANKPTVPTLPPETIAATEAVETQPVETEPAVTETLIPAHQASGKDIINILVIGNSAREGESSRLADTLILATVNKLDKTLTLSSFLRDAFVDLPDYMGHVCGSNRINVAYNLGYNWGGTAGAMEMTDITLKDNFGVEVDYNVEVDFDVFLDVVHLLGGVRVYLTAEEAAYLNKDLNQHFNTIHYEYEESLEQKVTLDPMSALSFARMRHASAGDSDINRSARQRAVITSMLKEISKLSFDKIQELADIVMPMIVTDMTVEEIKTCMWEIIPMLPELTINSQVIPADGTRWSIEFMVGDVMTYPLAFDAKKNREIMMNIAEPDQLAAMAATQPTTQPAG